DPCRLTPGAAQPHRVYQSLPEVGLLGDDRLPDGGPGARDAGRVGTSRPGSIRGLTATLGPWLARGPDIRFKRVPRISSRARGPTESCCSPDAQEQQFLLDDAPPGPVPGRCTRPPRRVS